MDIYQHEFDALVCYSYNVGTIPTTGNHINRGEVRAALKVIQSVNTSEGKEIPTLTRRRQREIALYSKGEYGTLPVLG